MQFGVSKVFARMKELALNLGQSKGRRTLDKADGFTTTFGAEAEFSGNIGGRGHYLILGHVRGDCDIEGTLVVGESGHWQGNVIADHILIAGKVEGDVVAREKMEIISTAHVVGTIRSQYLAIAEGAVHEGVVHMGREMDVKRFKDKRDS